MSVSQVLEVGNEALWMAMLMAAPILLTALAVGLLIGILQAATQIQEMTLSFIPKLLGVATVLLVAGPWMLTTMVEWYRGLVLGIPAMLG